MIEIIVTLVQSPAGVFLAILMGVTILSFVIWYGSYVIALPMMSLVSVIRGMVTRYREKKARVNTSLKKHTLNPQLGITMADGGKSIDGDEKEKEEE